MLKFGKFVFITRDLWFIGGIGLNLGQRGVVLVWYPFYLECTCFSGKCTRSYAFLEEFKQFNNF